MLESLCSEAFIAYEHGSSMPLEVMRLAASFIVSLITSEGACAIDRDVKVIVRLLPPCSPLGNAREHIEYK